MVSLVWLFFLYSDFNVISVVYLQAVNASLADAGGTYSPLSIRGRPRERGERTRRRRRRRSWGGESGGIGAALTLLAPSVPRPRGPSLRGTKTGKAQKHDRYKQCASEAPLIVV